LAGGVLNDRAIGNRAIEDFVLDVHTEATAPVQHLLVHMARGIALDDTDISLSVLRRDVEFRGRKIEAVQRQWPEPHMRMRIDKPRDNHPPREVDDVTLRGP